MDTQQLVETSNIKKTSFLEHVFEFNDDTKSNLINIIQYTVIAVIPVILLNKGVSKLIPEVDESKSTLEMSGEVMGQSLLIFFGIVLIHRFITYFPTYSKTDYPSFNVINLIILFLIIALSFQTRIGEKTNILIDRLFLLIEGRITLNKEQDKEQTHQQQQQQQPLHHPSLPRDNIGGHTNISQLPVMQPQQQLGGNSNTNAPNFDSMYAGPNNPLQNAHQPGQMREGFSEPSAANDGYGFGSTY